MKRFQHTIEYVALASFAASVRVLPLAVGRAVARLLADLVYFLVPIRRSLVVDNLAAAFPDLPPEAVRGTARRVYRQFSLTMMELLFLPTITPERLSAMVRINGLDMLRRVQAAGKGGLIVGGHFGNWELMGAAVAQHIPLTFVIGQQKNTRVDALLNGFRTSQGIELIPLKLSLRGVMKALKDNRFVAILADQDAHEHGAFVPFMGRPASTPKGPALFALRADCPLIFASMVRNPDGTFTATFEEVPRPSLTGDDERDIATLTAAHVAVLERYVRAHPDHWFWLHRRWKTKPPSQEVSHVPVPAEKPA